MTSREVAALLNIARVTVNKYARMLEVAKHGESYIFTDTDLAVIRDAMLRDHRKKQYRRDK